MHCVESHARQAVRVHSDARLPVAPTPSCENESSCICKGATLAIEFAPPDDVLVARLLWSDLLVASVDGLCEWSDADGAAWLPPPREGPSAGMLCALLQRFLI